MGNASAEVLYNDKAKKIIQLDVHRISKFPGFLSKLIIFYEKISTDIFYIS